MNKPVWLWWSGSGAAEVDVDRCWQSFLRRFDIEHTFRLLAADLRRPSEKPTEAHKLNALPRPAGDQEPAHDHRLPGRCTETISSWPRTAFGLEEPSAGHPS